MRVLSLIVVLLGVGPAGAEAQVPPTQQQRATATKVALQLKAKERATRYAAVMRLGELGRPFATISGPPLLAALAQDPSPIVRAAAAEALPKVLDVSASVASLRAALKADPSPHVWRAILDVLGEVGPSATVVPILTGALASRDVTVQKGALEALRQRGASAARSVPRVVPLLGNPGLRVEAIDLLGAIGPRARRAAPHLLGIAASTEPGAGEAARALARLQATRAIAALLRLEGVAFDRGCDAVLALRPRSLAAPLVPRLADLARTELEALITLARLGPLARSEALEVCVQGLDHAKPQFRLWSCLALEQHGSIGVRATLRIGELLATDRWASVRATAAGVLGRLRGIPSDCLRRLLAAATDRHGKVRLAVIEALATIYPRAGRLSLPVFVGAAADPNNDVQLAAVRALVRSRSREARVRAALEHAQVGDGWSRTKRIAAAGLRRWR